MPPKYTKEETIRALKEGIEKIDQLYNSECFKWTGQAEVEPYSEIISAYLIENNIVEKMDDKDKGIKQIERPKYKTDNHRGEINKTNRDEENFAKRLFQKKIGKLGLVVDYQVPLKKERADKAGKIDLITLNEKTRTAFIVELKYGENKETLLRTVLEIATYYRQLSRQSFIDSFEEYKGKGLNKDSVRSAVLVWEGTQAYREAKELAKRPKLRELIKILEVDLFIGSEKLVVECVE